MNKSSEKFKNFWLRNSSNSSSSGLQFAKQSPILSSDFYKGKPRKYSNKLLKQMNKISNKMTKTANLGACGSRGDTLMSSPMFYHPEYEPSSLLMPRDPIEVNAWSRYFYKYDPIVSTAIDAHAELPISTIRMTMPRGRDRRKNLLIQREYEEMCSTEYLDLFNKLLQIGVEYYKLGNVFPFAQWSEKQNKWVKLTILDSDYVEIDKLQFSDRMRVDLRPNDRLKEIVSNGPDHPKTGLLYQSIPNDVRELIITNKKIPLNTNPDFGSHIAHIAYKMADYDTLGTGLIERNFKALVYKDRLRQAQDAIAARHLTPKHLIWAQNQSNADVENIREQIDNAFADPDYAIITNYELHWDLIGTSQGLMSLDSEWNWINEELMIGLMINRSFLLGEGAFANGQTVLEVMNQRYSIYRERLESFIIHYLFLPMAKRNDWAEYEFGTAKKDKKLVWLYPKIKWNRLNFVDDTAHKQMLSQMVNMGQIDMETWLESFGLDAQTILERLERWQGTQLDINNFEMQKGIAAGVAQVLAPYISKIKAEEMGIDISKEEEQLPIRFAKKENKTEKKAETREERAEQRALRKKEREKEDRIKDLEVPIEKLTKPPRKDVKKMPLLEANNNSNISDQLQGMVDPDKLADKKNLLRLSELARNKWIAKMVKKGYSQNSRRAALALEDHLLSLTNKEDPEIRKHIQETFLPQIIACKINDDIPLLEKIKKAKEEYADEILKSALLLTSSLTKYKGCDLKYRIRKIIDSFV